MSTKKIGATVHSIGKKEYLIGVGLQRLKNVAKKKLLKICKYMSHVFSTP